MHAFPPDVAADAALRQYMEHVEQYEKWGPEAAVVVVNFMIDWLTAHGKIGPDHDYRNDFTRHADADMLADFTRALLKSGRWRDMPPMERNHLGFFLMMSLEFNRDMHEQHADVLDALAEASNNMDNRRGPEWEVIEGGKNERE